MIDSVSIGSTSASFGFTANEPSDLSCSFNSSTAPCGARTTTGSAVYAVSPGTYTFIVEARTGNPIEPGGVFTAAASTEFTVTSANAAGVAGRSPGGVTPGAGSDPSGGTGTPSGSSAGGTNTSTWIAAGAGLIALLLASLIIRWSLRRHRRLVWQSSATSEKPPPHCSRPGRWCTVKVTLKPGRREISYLVFVAEGETIWNWRSEGRPAKRLNEAVRTSRRGASTQEIRLAVLPAAQELVAEIGRLGGEHNGCVSISAHLEGGKAESEFSLYHCVGRPPKARWERKTKWTIEVADERDEPVGELTFPIERRSTEMLVAQLTAFITQVDVAAKERAPETVAIPHG